MTGERLLIEAIHINSDGFFVVFFYYQNLVLYLTDNLRLWMWSLKDGAHTTPASGNAAFVSNFKFIYHAHAHTHTHTHTHTHERGSVCVFHFLAHGGSNLQTN